MIPHIDPAASFRAAEKYIDSQVQAGTMSREEARRILTNARKNYRAQSYNRQADQINRGELHEIGTDTRRLLARAG